MEPLLNFFEALLTISAGIVVSLFWIVVIVLAIIEIHDRITEGKSTTLEEDDMGQDYP